jgi:hypothetical protein
MRPRRKPFHQRQPREEVGPGQQQQQKVDLEGLQLQSPVEFRAVLS